MRMKDRLAGLLAFLFAEDKKEHPMPPHRAETLLQKIQNILRGNAEDNDKNHKGE